jgi:hypothetical protein
VQDLVGRVDVPSRQSADELELDLACGQVVEQPPSSAEPDRHDVQLHLVERPGLLPSL